MSASPRLFVVLAVAAAAGCGSAPRSADVRGRVTYQGTPLSGMSLRFVTADGRESSAQIGFDGVYSAAAVPVGRVAVGVIPPLTLGPQAGPRRPVPGLPPMPTCDVKLPPKYRNPATSGVTLDVTPATTDLDITLP